MDRHPHGLIELVVLHSLQGNTRDVSWNDLPPVIKKRAEMSFYSGSKDEAPVGKKDERSGAYRADDAYSIYGVSKDEGAVCVVRPDGYVGAIASLENTGKVGEYLSTWLQLRSN